jgi:hypothetical protein
LIQKNRENGVLLSLFLALKKKKFMGLVTAKEVAKAINADKYGVLGTFSGWMLMKVLKSLP